MAGRRAGPQRHRHVYGPRGNEPQRPQLPGLRILALASTSKAGNALSVAGPARGAQGPKRSRPEGLMLMTNGHGRLISSVVELVMLLVSMGVRWSD